MEWSKLILRAYENGELSVINGPSEFSAEIKFESQQFMIEIEEVGKNEAVKRRLQTFSTKSLTSLPFLRFLPSFRIGLYYHNEKLDFTFTGGCLQTFQRYYTGFQMSDYKCLHTGGKFFLHVKAIRFENEKTFFTLLNDGKNLIQVRFDKMKYMILVRATRAAFRRRKQKSAIDSTKRQYASFQQQ